MSILTNQALHIKGNEGNRYWTNYPCTKEEFSNLLESYRGYPLREGERVLFEDPRCRQRALVFKVRFTPTNYVGD